MKQLLSLWLKSAALAAVLTMSTTGAMAAEGDAKAGADKAAMCIGCHGIVGYQASFPEVYKVPRISGQNAAYLAAALTAYKKGERRHPSMRGIAASLSEQDIVDLAAFYEASGSAAPAGEAPSKQASTDVGALIEKGACASCHGANFSKPIDPSYPKLAGQHADYLFVALKSYAREPNEVAGRANPIMGGVIKQFSTAELKSMAGYLASLQGELQTVPQSKFR